MARPPWTMRRMGRPQPRQGAPLKDRQRMSQLRLMQAADAKIAEARIEAADRPSG
jgi:hypothetical protein